MPQYDAQGLGDQDAGESPARQQAGTTVSVRDLARLLRVECADETWLSRTAFALRRVRAGEPLLRSGDKFHALYVVRSGCFKSVHTDVSGIEQVLGFPMSGDLMGADGIDSGHYSSSALSLDTSEVAIIPFADPARLAEASPGLEAMLYLVLSRELVRMQNVAWTLGTLGSKGRVAAFLLAFSARLGALGYSRCSFNLRMTRQELGSHLGLRLETVSRALSALHTSGAIQVCGSRIDIVDAGGLRRLINPDSAAAQLRSNAARADSKHGKRVKMPLLQPGFA